MFAFPESGNTGFGTKKTSFFSLVPAAVRAPKFSAKLFFLIGSSDN